MPGNEFKRYKLTNRIDEFALEPAIISVDNGKNRLKVPGNKHKVPKFKSKLAGFKLVGIELSRKVPILKLELTNIKREVPDIRPEFTDIQQKLTDNKAASKKKILKRNLVDLRAFGSWWQKTQLPRMNHESLLATLFVKQFQRTP